MCVRLFLLSFLLLTTPRGRDALIRRCVYKRAWTRMRASRDRAGSTTDPHDDAGDIDNSVFCRQKRKTRRRSACRRGRPIYRGGEPRFKRSRVHFYKLKSESAPQFTGVNPRLSVSRRTRTGDGSLAAKTERVRVYTPKTTTVLACRVVVASGGARGHESSSSAAHGFLPLPRAVPVPHGPSTTRLRKQFYRGIYG